MYLNGIIVFYQDPKSYLDHIDHSVTLLGEAGVKLKYKKCFFFRT